MASNKELRSYCKAKRDALTDAEIEQWSSSICLKVINIVRSYKTKKILAFYPFRNEVNIVPIFSVLLSEGYELYFPKTIGNSMYFIRVTDLEKDFSIGNFGIFEPIGDVELEPSEDMICITPGLVFDKACNRLGFGRGFYDRFFASNIDMTKIGLAYDFQLIDSIDVLPHDVALDYVITEQRIINKN